MPTANDANSAYLQGRKKYGRPQAMLWSENAGTLKNGIYVPYGYEIGATIPEDADPSLINQFMILSDDNRDGIQMSTNRIEKRERMINGRMRSYHIADKITISTSWKNLPSRSFSLPPEFNDEGISILRNPGNRSDNALPASVTGKNTNLSQQYTTDGGAGGVDLLDWYENHKGSFWVYLAYDKKSNFGTDDNSYGHLSQYNQLVEVFFSNFNYSITSRGANNYDFWDIDITLEEV
jgi:hypothetical protein